MPPAPQPLVQATDLVKRYGNATVVHGVSLAVQRGEILGLVGESGSGKSTVARMLLRLIEPSSGAVTFDGTDLLAASKNDLRRLRRRMGIVFQDPFAALDPRMRIRQILEEPFLIHREEPGGGRLRGDALRLRLTALLDEVGMPATALTRYPHEFSGGQRQRINIARALALRPEFLVLDEPVSALDVSVGAQVVNLLRDLQRRHGLTCLMISHSMPLVRYLCDRVAVLQRGRLVETGSVFDVCDHPKEPYTQALIAATPSLDTVLHKPH